MCLKIQFCIRTRFRTKKCYNRSSLIYNVHNVGEEIWEKAIHIMSVLAHLFIVLGFDSSDDIQIWVSLNNTHLGCRAVGNLT